MVFGTENLVLVAIYSTCHSPCEAIMYADNAVLINLANIAAALNAGFSLEIRAPT